MNINWLGPVMAAALVFAELVREFSMKNQLKIQVKGVPSE
jgi:hypothetical protein